MNKQEILDMMVDDVDQKKKAIVAYFTDETNSFENRWEVYSKTPIHLQTIDFYTIELGEYEDKYHHGEIVWYDDFFVDRHETVHFPDLLEQINELDVPDGVESDLYIEQRERCFKESAMKTGKHGFENDW